MKDNSSRFSFKRLFYFIRVEMREESKTWLVVLGVLSAVAGFLTLISNFDNSSSSSFLLGFFIPSLLISGSIYASTAFGYMHKKSSVHQWFALPVNDFEKFLGLLISTLIIWPLILLFLFSTLLNLVELLNLALRGSHNGFFNPLDPAIWYGYLAYLIIHPIYFAGGAFFKRLSWLFTSLCGVGFSALFTFFFSLSSAGVAFSFLKNDFFIEKLFSLVLSPATFNLQTDSLQFFSGGVTTVIIMLKIFAFFLFPVGLWVFSYLCVKEKEVKNAI
ncbi:MAG: hypothetical protein JXR63_00530 [Spirochaetales bacterium]|nr:hypothetical protein [Spirochaetales bacterium]